jgi:GNAT superfamily N-acetyltransferase
VSRGLSGTERFEPGRHDPSGFGCGNELLDRWLRRYAGQSDRRDAARTFVIATDDLAVRGYYTLLAGQLEHHQATAETRRGLSRHFPIPVAVLARLAVDSRYQATGLGALLLDDALGRICRAADQVAVRAVVVHAADQNAAAFYERFGFKTLSTAPRTLMVTLDALRAAGYNQPVASS